MWDYILSELSKEPWILVGVFLIVQFCALAFTVKWLTKIEKSWKNVDWKTITDDDGLVQIENASYFSEEVKGVISKINKYIKSHNGAVEFSVIKDKLERVVTSEYEYATSKIQFPTYFGLLGTFIGVWIGLSGFRNGLALGAGEVTNEMISNLIGGIIVSMLTSVFGLIFMVGSKWYADKILKQIDESQDRFIQFVQSEVLPTLGTNVTSSLNRLQNTIRKFEPSFREVIADFKSAFTDCADMFKGSFSENVAVLTHAVEAMGGNMVLINENIQKQDKLLATLQQSSLVDTLDKFVTAADRFESVSEAISKLDEVKEQIAASSAALAERQEQYNRSLEVPKALMDEINAVMNRVSTFEQSLNDFGENMNQTQLFRNEQLNLIEEQLKALRGKTNAVMSYQDTQVDELAEIYKVQNEAVSRLAASFRQAIDANGSDIEKTLSEFGALYGKLVQECRSGVERKLEEFQDALAHSLDFVDANKKLDNLDRLRTIDGSLNEMREASKSMVALTAISAELQEANSKLEMLGKKPSYSGAGKAAPVKKKTFLRRLFSKSEAGR